jgi:hypothetical protein
LLIDILSRIFRRVLVGTGFGAGEAAAQSGYAGGNKYDREPDEVTAL